MVLIAPSKNVFDPAKNYARVRWIGDRLWQDFEGIELQQIQDEARRQLGDEIFAQGAVLSERGGTIASATPGISVGNVIATSGGEYRGATTQIYTLKVIQGGGAGSAKIRVTSDGPDNGVEGSAYEFSIGAGDPLNGTVFYNIGSEGVRVKFTDNKAIKNFIVADSWTILATYRRRLPVVVGSTITPSDVNMYVDGRVIRVPSKTLTYPPASSGKNAVFVEVTRDIVTADIDPEIKAQLNNLTVAERERVVGQFIDRDTSNDALPEGILDRRVFPAYLWDRATNHVERATIRSVVIQLDDIPGQLPASSLANLDMNEQLSGVLAEVIDDLAGNSFRIHGLKARLSTNAPPAGKVLITVERGKARVSGLRINKKAEEEIPLDVATVSAPVIGESKTFTSGTNIYALNKGIGANKLPIKQVTQLSGIVLRARTITKGVANGLDELPDQPVNSIFSVVQGGTTYVATTSYVQNGNFVDWSPGGPEPAPGTSYTVTYRFTKQMVQPTDFALIDSDGDGDLDAVDFSPAGDEPVNTTTFFVNYDYYQPRIDIIFLRTDGAFESVKGIPADFPIAPKPPTQFLGIARVTLGPNSLTDIKISQFDNIRVTQAQLHDAIVRQEDQRRNDALQSLLDQTKLRETVAFKGVFTDAFASEENSDQTFNRLAGAGGVSPGSTITYATLIDLFNLELQLPVDITTVPLVRNDALLPIGSVASRLGRNFATLPFSEILEIGQDQWSEDRNINPFANFAPPDPQVRLVPDKDLAISEMTSNKNDIWLSYGGNVILRSSSQAEVNLWFAEHPVFREVGRAVPEIERLIEERAATFMREISVEVRGKLFAPSEDNIVGRFDGKFVALTPINGTPAGSVAGTVKARPTGDWEATFTIPANVPTGIRTFVATGALNRPANAPFDGALTERTITMFTHDIAVVVDPLAQSFGFSRPTTVVRINVPFASKGAFIEPAVTLQLRPVALPGGFPDLALFDDVTKQWTELNVGEFSINNFVFSDPIYQPGNSLRSLVLVSNSNQYHVYSATLGKVGLNPIAYITENPNLRGNEPAGILLESLNAINWEAASRTSLRYQLYRAEFQPESWLYFTRLSSVNYSQLYLSVDEVIPEGTSIRWQVSIDGLTVSDVSKQWIDIVPFSKLDLGVIATTIDVRARLSTTDTRISPYVNYKNWSLQGILYKAAGCYVSKSTVFAQDIAAVKVYCETQIPAGTTASFFISNSEDVSQRPIWESVTTLDSDVDLGDGFHDQLRSKTLNNGIADKVGFKKHRLRIDLATTNRAKTPRIRNLADTFS